MPVDISFDMYEDHDNNVNSHRQDDHSMNGALSEEPDPANQSADSEYSSAESEPEETSNYRTRSGREVRLPARYR